MLQALALAFFVCVCIPRLNHKQIELANAEEKMLGIQKQ
jgi:hypothetical protein